MDNLKKAKNLISSGEYTCVLAQGEKVYTSTQRGVKPLLALLDDNTNLDGFSCADKVVGKAAAFLYVLLKVKCVYAIVISHPAIDVLQNYGIYAEYETLVSSIRNRSNTGFCPMEQCVLSIDTPHEACKAIRQTLKKLQNNN